MHLDTVGLTYDDGDAEVLSDVSLRVAASRRLGLVGRTGSGKTSIARLLLRTVPVTSGEVRFGNVPCDTIPESPFRSHIAAVPQEVQLFPGTVRDNVALFDDDVSDVDVEKALALARLFCRQPSVIVLDEATSRIDPETQAQLGAATERLLDNDVAGFPEGLATRIGSRGIRLSGGQLQRAAAARAFVRHTELVVLDDLTSALDVETELLLWERLRSNGVTVLAASTRPAALAQADVILDLGRTNASAL